ncbi:MAG: LptF/LptG family permease, partial [Nitrospinales bacterium]
NEEVELSKRYSIPFTCLLFGLIGAPLGIKSSRSGKSGGFAISIGVVLLYYIGLISTQNLGSIGEIDSFISVWIPNFIAMAAGGYLVFKTHKEIPFKFFNSIANGFSLVFEILKRWYSRKLLREQPSEFRTLVVDEKQRKIDDATRKILKAKMKRFEMDEYSRKI